MMRSPQRPHQETELGDFSDRRVFSLVCPLIALYIMHITTAYVGHLQLVVKTH
jgi:hypothetical protein